MQQKMYGYIRVSTREQNEERQRIALLEMGVPKERIYVDLNEQWRRITKEKGRFGRQEAMLCDMPCLLFIRGRISFGIKRGISIESEG